MAVRIIDDNLSVASSYPQIINTAADDAISLIPGLVDQWWVSTALVTGTSAASTFEWEGLSNGKKLLGRTGVNARPMDYISAFTDANSKDVLRSGWDSDASTPAFDGNNERTQLISAEELFDGGSFCLFTTVIVPSSPPDTEQIWGNNIGTTTTRLQIQSTDGSARYFQNLDDGTLFDEDSQSYADGTPYVIGIGYDATDEVVKMRINGVLKQTQTSHTDAPDVTGEGGKLVIAGNGTSLSSAFTGYYRSIVMVNGASLMQSKALASYDGDEDDALQAIEQGLMEDVGLTYPT